MTRKNIVAIILAASLLAAGGITARAQGRQHPKLTEAQARDIALRRAGGGRVESAELESERGVLVWSFDIAAGDGSITEVLINADSGAVLDVQQESAVDEAAEARKEGEAGAAAEHVRRLVARFVADHRDVEALEVALGTGESCRTVAASDPDDVGEACDEDELRAMRTGEPVVGGPESDGSVYDVTQALHDAEGRLIGAVGMDVRANGRSREEVIERAKELLTGLQRMNVQGLTP